MDETTKIHGVMGLFAIDRIDIHIEVPAVKYRDLASREAGESSREIKKRIDAARGIQIDRFKGMKIYWNAQMTNRHTKKFCQIDEASHQSEVVGDEAIQYRTLDRNLIA